MHIILCHTMRKPEFSITNSVGLYCYNGVMESGSSVYLRERTKTHGHYFFILFFKFALQYTLLYFLTTKILHSILKPYVKLHLYGHNWVVQNMCITE